jgi:phospholipid/cholesterol/gamma-HCH transport system substrate-binding protein
MKTRLELKVGLFVFIGLVVLAVLLIGFSKGTTLFRSTYTILLHLNDVVGLQRNADVLMSGVKVGSVSAISLAPGGKSVTISLRIYREYAIHKDATFRLEQSGFLGDQYVAIQPNENKKSPFADMDEAIADQAFSIQAAARTATGFVERLDHSLSRLDETLDQVRRLVINEETLTNLSSTVASLRQVSEKASITVNNVNSLLASNGPALNRSGSNLVVFTEQMNQFASGLNDVLKTNSGDIHQVLKNVEDSTEQMNAILSDVRAGKGLVGSLTQDDRLSSDFATIANNLSITTSNLNRLGLWGVLWKQKEPRSSQKQTTPLSSPKTTTN